MIHTLTNSYSMHEGGAEKLALQLHQALLARGGEAAICGLYQNDQDVDGAVDIHASSPYSWRAFWGLARYCKGISRGDVVHIHLFPTILYCAVFRRIGWLKGRLIFTEHNTHNRRRNTRWGKWLDRWMYRSLDQVVAISGATAEELTQWLPFLQERTRVIHNGIPLLHDQPFLHRGSQVIRMVSVGNLRAQKNYITALEAFALLSDLDVQWTIAGEGPMHEAIQEKIVALGLKERVHLLGHVDRVPELLENSDLFFLPSLWEGFGLAVVEAMDASLPLAVSDVPGLHEVVGDVAERFDPRDPGSMADCLRQLITDPVLRADKAKVSFERSRQFGFSAMFESYLSLYGQHT